MRHRRARRKVSRGDDAREYAEFFIGAEKIVLVAPQTFMNLSGVSVQQVMNWYKAELDDLLVVYDDLDLPMGQLRVRATGSPGGHNGLRSITQELGTQSVPRLRVGIGRGPGTAVAHVLSKFSVEEAKLVPNDLAEIDHPGTRMAHIALRPAWVAIIDFQSRLPAALGGLTG